ncbi:MAG: NAD(P)-dependent alcohol dehydrogenase [Actinomycetota bacterium]
MRAIVRSGYGLPNVLSLQQVPRPEVGPTHVLVKVSASSVNALEWHMMTGSPYLVRLQAGLRSPKRPTIGADIAGIVEAVGEDVTRFAVGDRVFGETGTGGYAEYAVAREDVLASIPTETTFEQAAATPVAAFTALQGLRDHGRIQRGQHVLINGASGGVGTFAIQIAKALGAEVTAVCSTRNMGSARTLGADHVIDYTRESYAERGERYDLMLDIVGTGPISEGKLVLKPGGRYVVVGGPKGKWLGPLPRLLRAKLAYLSGGKSMAFFVANPNAADLEFVADLLETGQIVPLIEATYPLGEAPDALRQFGHGHAQGKTVITIP